jgi:small subunit ribosomal protein S16
MIRLQRIGKRKQPSYRFIISEKTRDTQAGSLEILGEYNPVLKEKLVNLKEDRIRYWLSKGAQASDTVHNILVKSGIVEAKKRDVVTISKKREKKLDAKKAADVEKKAAAEAKKVAEEAAKKQAEEEAKAAKKAAAEAEAQAAAEAVAAPAADVTPEAAPVAEEAPAEPAA